MANAPTRRSTRFSMRSKQLGQLLLDDNVIQAEHIAKALKIQEKKGGLVGQILRDMGCCDDAAIAAALLKQVQVTDIHCEDLAVEPACIAKVSRDQCEADKLCPFEVLGNLLCVVMGNPLNRKAINALEDSSRLKVKPFKAPWAKIHELIDRTYTDDNVAAAGEVAEAGPMLDLPEELPAMDLDEASAPTEIRLPEVGAPEPEPEPEPDLSIEGLDELDENQAELIETDNRGLSQRNRKPRILDESQAKNLPKKEAKVNVDLDTLDLSEASEVVGTPDAGGEEEEEEELEEISAAAAAPEPGKRAIEPFTLTEVGDDFFFTADAVPQEGSELPPAFFELIAQLPEAEVVAESLEAWEASKASKVQAAVKASGKRAAADLPLELQPAPAGAMAAVAISEAEFQTLSAGCDADPLGEWDWQYAAGGPVEAVEYEAEAV